MQQPGNTVQNHELSEDIFHYVEDLVHRNGKILTGIGALTLLVAINAVLIFRGDGTGSVVLMVISALVLPFAYHFWFKNLFRLARFSVSLDRNYRVIEVRISPLSDVKKFQVIPRQHLRNPDQLAPEDMVDEIGTMALALPDLHKQLQVCQDHHNELTNHDVANLFLLQESLLSARNPRHIARIKLPEDDNKRLAA